MAGLLRRTDASMPRDHYATLGIARDAAPGAVKAAYHRAAKAHHPDLNPGDPAAAQRFSEASAAWEVLRDPARREEYDRASRPPSPSARAAPPGRPSPRQDTRPPRQDARPPRPAAADPRPGDAGEVRITLAQAFSGATVRGRLEALGACTECGGAGSVFAGIRTCSACAGQGRFAPGWACGACSGTGLRAVPAPCPGCRGSGTVVFRGEPLLRVPPGADDGDALVVSLPDGSTAAVRVRMARDARYRREGPDLSVVRRVSPAKLLRGTTVSVRLPWGPSIRLRVPPGSRQGLVLRVRGRGLPRRDGSRGDLLVRLEESPGS